MYYIFYLDFYQLENGRVPVQDFLYSLVKPIKGEKYKGLFELRINFSNDIVRIFYFIHYQNKFILLHGFIKKTMKTPSREIERAKKYMEDYIRRNEYE